MSKKQPLLAITMGDAAGIGPEVIVRSLTSPEMRQICRAIVIGDAGVMRATVQGMEANLSIHAIQHPAEARHDPDAIDVLDLENIRLDELTPGQLSPMAGRAAYEYVIRAVDLAMKGQVDGIVTAPLNKKAMHLGGCHYPGHTEILAEKTGTDDFTMMLVSGNLRVVLVTIHVSLREAIDLVDRERVVRTIRLTDRTLRRMGIAAPRLAVAGLNPHAGEDGLFGQEDNEEIVPAVEQAQTEGIDAQGPFPPDTIFLRAVNGEFDAVIAMYHDQGLIPLKTIGFSTGVNVTLGLPIIRTSVDHGTAFDIAWQWKADAESLNAAIRLAAQMSAQDRVSRAS